MPMAALLSSADLPQDFHYPSVFLRVVELGLTNLEPWWIIEGEMLDTLFKGLQQRYPRRTLIPFARRQDNDDVACFDIDSGKLSIIHDWASPGWEQRTEFATFTDWLRQAIEDLISFT